jgi:hypothetical protein
MGTAWRRDNYYLRHSLTEYWYLKHKKPVNLFLGQALRNSKKRSRSLAGPRDAVTVYSWHKMHHMLLSRKRWRHIYTRNSLRMPNFNLDHRDRIRLPGEPEWI